MHQDEKYCLGLRTYVDNTTSTTYTYICKALDPKASTSAKVWVCYRITNSSGSKSFANGINNFNNPDALVKATDAATLTYV